MSSRAENARRKQACMECRLAKYKCRRRDETDDNEDCLRCAKYGFQCVTVQHRKGRKPKSRLKGRNASEVGPLSHARGSVKETGGGISQSGQVSSETLLSRSVSNDSEQEDVDMGGIQALLSLHNQGGVISSSLGQGTSSRPENSSCWDPQRLAQYMHSNVQRRRLRRALPYTMTSSGIDEVSVRRRADGRLSEANIRIRQRPKNLASILEPLVAPPSSPAAMRARIGNQSRDEPCDVITEGQLTLHDAQLLFAYFMAKLNRWSCILDPQLHTHAYVRSHSPFLYTVMLFLAAKLMTAHVRQSHRWDFLGNDDDDDDEVARHSRLAAWHRLRDQLHVRSRDLAARAFVDGDRSTEAVQAFFFLATWKEADDSLTHIQSGFAFRLTMDMRLGDVNPYATGSSFDGHRQEHEEEAQQKRDAVEVHFRKRQRTYLQVFVQDRIQSVHFVSNFTISASESVVQGAELWKDHRLAAAGDAFCCAAVEVRKIQTRYQELLDGGGRTFVRAQPLLYALQRDLDEWSTKWQVWVRREESQDEDEKCQSAAMLLWKNSIQLHLSSSMLRPSPSTREANTLRSGLLQAHDPVLALCLETARDSLLVIDTLPPHCLCDMPDALSLEVARAARFLCSMVCVCDLDSLGDGFLDEVMVVIERIARAFEIASRDWHDTTAYHARFLRGLLSAGRAPEASFPSMVDPVHHRETASLPLFEEEEDHQTTWMNSPRDPFLTSQQPVDLELQELLDSIGHEFFSNSH